ncbi:nucleotidyltransferase domain-containing protein [Chitinophaga deserti]|uniref:nucleotidyltransferase domain-containing protein n=1 Tax=Chitinophaga deserti TaxID=2164099 RepID=UPI0018E54566|nr:nucleotidyltransferase [Chitinophaga deserti]
MIINKEQERQISAVLNGLGEGLDISPTEYERAVESYEAVGGWLAAEGSPLTILRPEIQPQGSFLLGTMIKPVNETDDLDIDLVCRLSGVMDGWTQANLKAAIGNRLRDHKLYAKLLRPEGRRNWTLKYVEGRGFHLDILPSVVGQGFFQLLEKSMDDGDMANAQAMAIRITDTLHPYYKTSSDILNWPSSNMFGFAAWFKYRSQITTLRKSLVLYEAIQPVPKQQHKKLPLQRVVQILKRHRDIMFKKADNKPISIIITTLAAWAYNGEDDVLSALKNVVAQMERYIEKKYDVVNQHYYYWIGNPVNPMENFADKWPTCHEKEENFWKWMRQVKKDIALIAEQDTIFGLKEAIEKPFGESLVKSVFANMGNETRTLRENGGLYMAAGTGILGTSGRTSVPDHKFHGSNEL